MCGHVLVLQFVVNTYLPVLLHNILLDVMVPIRYTVGQLELIL